MGSQEVLETTMAFCSTDGVHDSGSEQAGIGMEQNEDVNVEFLEEYDGLMEDVDNRLRVARMVSDSVIKGMVSAVEQDADEKIKAKELELESLKRSLSFFDVNGDRNESTSFEDVCVKHDKMKESVTDEFKRLRKQIEGVKGGKLKRNGSYEMVGLGGILKDENDIEKTVDNLEMMMNNMSKLVDTVLIFSKDSLSEWQHKHELKEELEDMVIQSSIKCIQEEFQEAGSQNLLLAEKFSNISDLRNELVSLTKLLPSHDSGHLISHGSLDVDMTHGNPLRSQLSSRWEENGESTESKPDVADSYDANTLSHMNKEELVKFFNNMMLDRKREHEAELHEMADNYINLRRKYLNERQSFVPLIKDFDVLKKKIPEVVAKLDDILNGIDGFVGKGDNVVSLNSVLRENRQLRDSLAFMKDEGKNLSSQLTIVSEVHKSFMADAFLEASIVEDVYKCVIRELNCHIQNMKEESELEIVAMQDIYKVLLENTSIYATEDMRVESLFMQELLETVFKETLMDVNQKLESIHEKYITTSENLVSFETKAMAMQAEMTLEVEEREKLRNQVNFLRSLMEEKETLARDEINNLRKQETLMLKTNKELDEMREKLSKAEEKLLSDKMEIHSLNQRLALAMEEIKTSNEYKNMFLDLTQEKQRFMSQIEAKEREHRKKMEAVVVLVDELTAKFVDFESRVTWDVKNNYTRLENSRTQLGSLVTAANVLKNTGILYKQKLEMKCCDLQMAEEEVDLLGDEVETLLGLLQKIYIALDHYSPVLQHYPGVIEILELVRRELSGESLKPHRGSFERDV
ncbi:hypothetical protein L1987_32611 [Smallanthus sonchifolius]|uniref:Uncharacterized protein n=1 Tax=Smallanthus sonchifolius TaxID=185202 RepID=A0ACB9HNR0_9ASTR|nr:hypothetical protein L1987_32611 [Smallanthus sonchifolius]